jgi:hypothetical protein
MEMQQAAAQELLDKRKRSAPVVHRSTAKYQRIGHSVAVISSGVLRTEGKKCAHGKCVECGVSLRLPLTCPVDNDAEYKVVVRVFRDVKRGEMKQKELVEEKWTGKQLMEGLVKAVKKYLPHRFDCSWGLHHRRLLYETFPDTWLVVNTDFSATLDLDPQHKLNSAHSAHSVQDVFLVSDHPVDVPLENGKTRRVITNAF